MGNHEIPKVEPVIGCAVICSVEPGQEPARDVDLEPIHGCPGAETVVEAPSAPSVIAWTRRRAAERQGTGRRCHEVVDRRRCLGGVARLRRLLDRQRGRVGIRRGEGRPRIPWP